MRKITFYIVTLILLLGCNSSKWETIKGNGISDEPKSIGNVIYFENENNGLVGGFTLIEDGNAKTADGLSLTPTLFLTEDGGQNWNEVKFNPFLRNQLVNAYLSGDTLVCQLDTILLLSIDKGKSFRTINDSLEKSTIIDLYFKGNRYDIKDHNFLYNNSEYKIKERYQSNLAIVNVCYKGETLSDYYFVSFNNGNDWVFLQESFGNNRARFLLEDKYLYYYDFPFGLKRLKLK